MVWHGGRAIWSTSAGFQAETIRRRESGFFLIISISLLIWSIDSPFGAGQLRHW